MKFSTLGCGNGTATQIKTELKTLCNNQQLKVPSKVLAKSGPPGQYAPGMLASRCSVTLPLSRTSLKAGHPHPESYLVSELNRSWWHTMHWYTPFSQCLLQQPVDIAFHHLGIRIKCTLFEGWCSILRMAYGCMFGQERLTCEGSLGARLLGNLILHRGQALAQLLLVHRNLLALVIHSRCWSGIPFVRIVAVLA